MINTWTINIYNWYPWKNEVIIFGKAYKITNDVNNKLYHIYECNGFPKKEGQPGMPHGPFKIKLHRFEIGGTVSEIIFGITYRGSKEIRRSYKQKPIRKLIEDDRAKAKEWIKFVKGNIKENLTVGDINTSTFYRKKM